MPPRGWIKTKDQPKQEESKIIIEKKAKKIPDDLGEQMKPITEDQFKTKVLIVWRDSKGKQRTTQYIMSEDFEIRENLTEQYTASGYKKAYLHLNLDGTVLEKT